MRRWLRIPLLALLAVSGALVAAFLALHWNDGRITTRRPPPADYASLKKANQFRENVLTELPQLLGQVEMGIRLDLRSSDLTALDLRGREAFLLNHASFDSRTQWPVGDNSPQGFDANVVLQLGKNPGLGIRQLHEKGITGRGVSIGIIDGALLREHVEYADRLRHYEEIEPLKDHEPNANFHGCAVASIAAGGTVGVAPEADVYYIGATVESTGFRLLRDDSRSFCWIAAAIRRLVEINQTLPADHKLRVISISAGWESSETCYQEAEDAVHMAEAAGILILSTCIDRHRDLFFHGLERPPLADPESPGSYEPGVWWKRSFKATYDPELGSGSWFDAHRGMNWEPGDPIILVPMDSRTTASPTGPMDYVFYREGGWSWSVPYIAGLYALTSQVRPDVTPEEFWRTCERTGTTMTWEDGGRTYRLGPVVNPVALIEVLSRNQKSGD